MPPAGQTVIRDRPNCRWTPEEEAALRAGIAKHGAGKWQQIITDPDPAIGGALSARSNVDLKDKYRNMHPKRSRQAQQQQTAPATTASQHSFAREASFSGGSDGKRACFAQPPAAAAAAAQHPAFAWQATLTPRPPASDHPQQLAGIDPSVAAILAAAHGQSLGSPATVQQAQAMLDYATAWSAAQDHHGAMLAAASQHNRSAATAAVHLPVARRQQQLPHRPQRPVSPGKCDRLSARLREACEQLDASEAAALLHEGADAAAKGKDGNTALHAVAAAARGSEAAAAAGLLLELLLQSGAQLDARNEAGAAPLHMASDAPMAAVLLSAGAAVDAANNAGETPLFGGAAANADALVRVLLQHGANPDHQDDCGETALIRACSRDDAVRAALQLVDAGASVNIVDGAGRTALHAAAECGCSLLVNRLLMRGGLAGLPDSAGDTPLTLASRNMHIQVTSQLVVALSSQFG